MNFILILLSLFFVKEGLITNNYQDQYEFTFRVQIAASPRAIPKNAKLYEDLPGLEGVQFEDGYIRYFVGKYETYHEAKEGLKEVQEKGYKEAYVICMHKGKRLTADEAIMMIYGEE